jgi:archaellum biogenesis ATPase FlaH
VSKETGKEKVQGVLLGHYPCSECGSNDNLAVYIKTTDDIETIDATCFTPNCKSFWSEQDLKEAGVLDENFEIPKGLKAVKREKITPKEFKELTKIATHDTKLPDGTYYRGILPEIAKMYGHLYARDANGWIIREYYPETRGSFVNDGSTLVGCKSKTLPKRYGTHNLGITGISNDFSGQHLFKSGGQKVLITSGENDKLAAAQMLSNYQKQKKNEDYKPYAVVSVTSGEGGLERQCRENYDWLDSFDEIILCMDNDEAGRIATKSAIKALPLGKIKLMTTTLKDANEMLLRGMQRQFLSDFFSAKDINGNDILNAVDAANNVTAFLTTPKITLPPQLHRLEAAMRGGVKSTGAIVNIIGNTSVGKSFFTDTLVHHWIYHSPLKPTILTIERTAEELLIDLYSYHLKQNLTWFTDGHDAVKYLTQPEVKALTDDLLMNENGEPRFHIIDDRCGEVNVLKKQIERAVKHHGSNLIILDVLTDVLRGLPLDQQEDFMLFEKQMKKEGVVFINVLHTRKPQSNGDGDGSDGNFKRVTEYDILGSGSIPQSADINIVLNRNKMAQDPIEKNTTYLTMPKCRGGETGDICQLLFDTKARQQFDKEDWLVNNAKLVS